MGELPLNSVVTVNISTSPSFVSQAGFGTLMCVTDEVGVLTTTERVRSYIDADGVISDWGVDAEVSKMATAYFSQKPKPQGFKVGFMDSTETPTEALSAINDFDSSWFGIAFIKTVRDLAVINLANGVETIADWAEARTKMFFTVTNSLDALDAASQTDIAYILKQKSLSNTFIIYSSSVDQYPEVSVAGRAFSVDFTAGNPSITLKFKQLPTITVEGLSANSKAVLDSKGCNAFISIAGNSILAEGVMSGGRFLDEVHGLAWLQNTIEENIFLLLYSDTKVSYTNTGAGKVASVLNQSLAAGVTAGLLAPGFDSDGNYLNLGYNINTTPVNQVLPTKKEARVYDGISFTALGSGAIHFVTINGVFER